MSAQALLWVTRGLLRVCVWGPVNALKCETDPSFILPSYHLEFLPFAHVASACRGLFLIWVCSLSPLCVNFSLGLLGVNSGSAVVNPEQTPKVNTGFSWSLLWNSFRLGLIGIVTKLSGLKDWTKTLRLSLATWGN